MNARPIHLVGALLAAALTRPTTAAAQSLAGRIADAAGSRVEFRYATRDGVCGDGRTYVHVSAGAVNEFYGSFGDLETNACMRGPARVVIDRAGGSIIGLHVYVGPITPDGATDLGAVPAPDAAGFLMRLAATASGAVARDAILPAMIADSADNRAALVALARDKSRSEATRRTAIAWLGRPDADDASIVTALLAIATDSTDGRTARQQAMNALVHLAAGVGIPPLLRLAADSTGGWTTRSALSAVAQSGDPRAHDFLRGIVRTATLPDPALATAIRGLGRQFATAADIALIRDTWPRFTGPASQDAAIAAAVEFGGGDNVKWLLSLAGDMGTTSGVRRHALEGAAESGAPTADLATLYDRTTDPQLKEEIISALVRADDRMATDKLIAIAKQDESPSARRRAVDALGRLSDPRARRALEALVERRL